MVKLNVLGLLVICGGLVLATNEAGEKNESSDALSSSVLERISVYQSSIRRWDTQNPDVQKEILKQLAEETQNTTKLPGGCPRIRYPMICDDSGVLLENICYFKMRRNERQETLPVLVFTNTPIGEARAMCEKEQRKP